MAVTLDENDPCATAAALRQVYANLISGGASQSVSFKAGPNGVERTVTYHSANATALKALITEYEQKCAALKGGRPRRFAMRGGGRL